MPNSSFAVGDTFQYNEHSVGDTSQCYKYTVGENYTSQCYKHTLINIEFSIQLGTLLNQKLTVNENTFQYRHAVMDNSQYYKNAVGDNSLVLQVFSTYHLQLCQHRYITNKYKKA